MSVQGAPRHRFVFWLSVAFLASVFVQGTLAGLGFMADGGFFAAHRNFVHVFELLPIVAAITLWVQKGPVWMRWAWAGLFLLVGFQYGLIQAPNGYVRALHVANAFVIFGLALWLLMRLRGPLPQGKATAAAA